MVKVILTCVKKVIGSIEEQSKLHDSPMNKDRGIPGMIIEEIIKRDLKVNNIYENLVFNRTE